MSWPAPSLYFGQSLPRLSTIDNAHRTVPTFSSITAKYSCANTDDNILHVVPKIIFGCFIFRTSDCFSYSGTDFAFIGITKGFGRYQCLHLHDCLREFKTALLFEPTAPCLPIRFGIHKGYTLWVGAWEYRVHIIHWKGLKFIYRKRIIIDFWNVPPFQQRHQGSPECLLSPTRGAIPTI